MSGEQQITVRDLQLALLGMMRDFDCICKENGIQYSLAWGTLLGAVRHKGFIPWDDDVDLNLTRENYEKLLSLDNEVFQKRGYTLQKEFSKSWSSTYSKLCKNNTTYVENYRYKNKEQHHGIFIDIMPIDHLSENRFKQRIQWYCYRLLAAKTLFPVISARRAWDNCFSFRRDMTVSDRSRRDIFFIENSFPSVYNVQMFLKVTLFRQICSTIFIHCQHITTFGNKCQHPRRNCLKC